jgi:undecaprenyl-diphosphatase
VFEKLEQIDREIFLALNDVHLPWLDPIMWYASQGVTWIPLYLFFVWFAWKKQGWKFVLVILLGAGFCILIADMVSVYAFKEVFQRYRPSHNLDIKHLVKTVLKPDGSEYRGGDFGFISSHAANFGAISMLLFLHFRQYSNWWWLLFLWFALICYTRIYLGVHYPSDLVGGGILGFITGYLVYRLSIRFLQPKKNPA